MDASVMDVVRLLQAGSKTESTVSELSARIAALLSGPEKAALLQQAGDLVVLLDDFADAASTPNVAAQALCLAAELCAAAGMADHGVERLSAALDHDPAHQAAAHQLQRTLGAPAQRSRLLALLTARAQTLCHMQGMEEVAAAAMVQIGNLRLDADDIDRAIEAYDRALDLSPEISTVTELATLYVERDAPGDRNQAAELYCALYDILEPDEGRPHLERALALAPGHPGASERLAEAAQGLTQVSQMPAAPAPSQAPASGAPTRQMAAGQPEQLQVTMGPAQSTAQGQQPARPALSPVPPPMTVSTLPAPGGRTPTLQPPRAVGVPIPSAQMPEPAPAVPVGAAASAASAAQTVRPAAPSLPANAEPVPAPSVPARSSEPDFPVQRSGRSALLYGAAAATLIVAGVGIMWMQRDSGVATSTSAATAVANPASLAADNNPAPIAEPGAKQPLPAVAAAVAADNKEPAAALAGAKPAAATEASPTTATGASKPEPATVEAPSEPLEEIAVKANAVEPQAKKVASVREKKRGRKAKKRPRALLQERKVRFRGSKVKKKPYLAALNKALPKVERCYKRAVKKNKRLKGSITYDVRVRRNGRVAAVRKASGNLRDRRLFSCSSRAFKKVRFPKFRKGKMAKLRVPIRFERSAAEK